MTQCSKCKIEIAYEKNVMYIGTTGVKRKQPLCIYCHEDAVRGAGRSAAKVSRWNSVTGEVDMDTCDSNGDESQWAFWYEHPQFRIQGLD